MTLIPLTSEAQSYLLTFLHSHCFLLPRCPSCFPGCSYCHDRGIHAPCQNRQTHTRAHTCLRTHRPHEPVQDGQRGRSEIVCHSLNFSHFSRKHLIYNRSAGKQHRLQTDIISSTQLRPLNILMMCMRKHVDKHTHTRRVHSHLCCLTVIWSLFLFLYSITPGCTLTYCSQLRCCWTQIQPHLYRLSTRLQR